MCDELQRIASVRGRSLSLPVPDIKVSTPDSLAKPPIPANLAPTKEDSESDQTDFMHHARFDVSSMNTCQSKREYHGVKKRKHDQHKHHGSGDLHCLMQEMGTMSNILRPMSAFVVNCPSEASSEENLAETWRRKSMPPLRNKEKMVEDDGLKSKTPTLKKKELGSDLVLKPDFLLRPIITITEHSQGSQNSSQADSLNDFTSESEHQDPVPTPGPSTLPLPPIPITRSKTDSNINYNLDENIAEAAGSAYYIQENGHLDYGVILKAVHTIAEKQVNTKICEAVLNILGKCLKYLLCAAL